MKENNKKLPLYLASLLVFLFILIVIIPYSATFGKNGLSDQHQAWANFGGYFGGVLSPIFSALAFIGIWLTYRAQQTQLRFAEKRSTIDELQRLLSTTAAAIELTLTHPIQLRNEINNDVKTFLLSEILACANCIKHNPLESDDLTSNYIGSEECVKLFNRLESQFKELCWCMGEFQAAGGSSKIIDFYRMKFQVFINDFSNADSWELNDEILRYFPTTD